MNIQYRQYPIDYIQELQNQGKREKARCFWEYWHDVEMRAVNSISFYARSWGGDEPKSKGTVHKWVREFVDEIQRYHDAKSLYNTQHYRSVKKQSERQVNGKRTKRQTQSTTTPQSNDLQRTASERQVNEVNTSNNNNTRAWYDSFYMIYRMNNKYAGSKMKAYESFKLLSGIDYTLLTIAGVRYCHDPAVSMKVGVKKFLDDEIYLGYMSKQMSILVGDGWIAGEYDSDKEVFVSDETEYSMTIEKMIEKFAKGELKFGEWHDKSN